MQILLFIHRLFASFKFFFHPLFLSYQHLLYYIKMLFFID